MIRTHIDFLFLLLKIEMASSPANFLSQECRTEPELNIDSATTEEKQESFRIF